MMDLIITWWDLTKSHEYSLKGDFKQHTNGNGHGDRLIGTSPHWDLGKSKYEGILCVYL